MYLYKYKGLYLYLLNNVAGLILQDLFMNPIKKSYKIWIMDEGIYFRRDSYSKAIVDSPRPTFPFNDSGTSYRVQ